MLWLQRQKNLEAQANGKKLYYCGKCQYLSTRKDHVKRHQVKCDKYLKALRQNQEELSYIR